jgi:hypothetical protein
MGLYLRCPPSSPAAASYSYQLLPEAAPHAADTPPPPPPASLNKKEGAEAKPPPTHAHARPCLGGCAVELV